MFLHLPKIKTEYSFFMKLADTLTLLIVGVMFYRVWSSLPDLPNLVPSHFNMRGNADAFAPRSSLFILPGISLLLTLLLTAMRFEPRYFNLPIKVTERNAAEIFQIALHMMAVLQIYIASCFAMLVFLIVEVALGQREGLPLMIVPSLVFGIFLIAVFYLLQMRKIARLRP